MVFMLMLILMLIIQDGVKEQRDELESLKEEKHLCLMAMKKK